MSGVLRWETPAEGRTTAAAQEAERWHPVAQELRGNPETWAVIAEGDVKPFNRITAYIREGRGPFGPKGAFQVRQRTNIERGRGGAGRAGVLYARYVGTEDGL